MVVFTSQKNVTNLKLVLMINLSSVKTKHVLKLMLVAQQEKLVLNQIKSFALMALV